MARIINLNEAVGEDIVFQYGKPVKDYAIPGDIDVGTVFELFEKYVSVAKIEEDDAEVLVGAVKERFAGITAKLMEVLQVRQPTLKTYPFGVRGTGIVLREILSALGVNVSENPPAPTPNRAQRRSATKKKTTASRKK
jgi:hypothetical protein